MTRKEFQLLKSTLEKYAERIQNVDDAGDKEQLYNELWAHLDDAGALITEVLEFNK